MVLSGCAHFRDEPSSAVPPAEPPVAVEPPPAVAPSPPRPKPPPPRPVPTQALLLYESSAAGYADVAAEIAASLPAERYAVRLVDLDDQGAVEEAKARSHPGKAVTIAVGLDAARYAKAQLGNEPLVFCQVFNYGELLDGAHPVFGVESLPPLALQLAGWKAVDAALAKVGLIASAGQRELVTQAREAAAQAGIELKVLESASDRETLYLFKRMAGEIDGLWLFPDNRILSPSVIQELLNYALSHDVGVLVFNDALLRWGALLSVSTTPANVASAVGGVVDRIVAGRVDGLPSVSALSAIKLNISEVAAKRLGITLVPVSPWVMHAPD